MSSLRQLKKAAEERKAAAGKGEGGRWDHDRYGQEDNDDDDEEERVRELVCFLTILVL